MTFQATPEPEIVWKKGGEEIEAGDKYEMKLRPMCAKYKCTLKIKVGGLLNQCLKWCEG